RNAVQDLARLVGVGFAFGPAHRITPTPNAATRLLSQDPEAKGRECSRRTSPPLRGISVAVRTDRPLWFIYQVFSSSDWVVVRRSDSGAGALVDVGPASGRCPADRVRRGGDRGGPGLPERGERCLVAGALGRGVPGPGGLS